MEQGSVSPVFTCKTCGIKFSRERNLKRHVEGGCKSRVGGARFKCSECEALFSRKDTLSRHMRARHMTGTCYRCSYCSKHFSSKSVMRAHKATHVREDHFSLYQSAHEGTVLEYRYLLPDVQMTFEEAAKDSFVKVRNLVRKELLTFGCVKIQLFVHCQMVKEVENLNPSLDECEGVNSIMVPFASNSVLLSAHDKPAYPIAEAFFDARAHLETFVQRGSGWRLFDVKYITLKVAKSRPLLGECEHTVKYNSEKGIYMENFSRSDGSCFLYAVASGFLFENASKKEKNKFIREHMKVNIKLPVKVEEIAVFEKDNEHLNFSINVVYNDEENRVIPCYASKNISARHTIVLLLSFLPANDAYHYSHIRHPEKLLAQRNKYGKKCVTRPKYFCYNCFMSMTRREALIRHTAWCHTKVGQIRRYPGKGEVERYKMQTGKEEKAPFMIFYDFECVNKYPENFCKCTMEELRGGMKCPHKSIVEADQEACAFSVLLCDRSGEVLKKRTYIGEDAGEECLRTILKYGKWCKRFLRKIVPIQMTVEEEIEFARVRMCSLCDRILGDDRVRDHDHFTGRYRGAAHKICNLKRTKTHTIPAFAHNFVGYDSHIIVKAMAKAIPSEKIKKQVNAIPLNTERLKTLNVGNIRFLDSAAFLPGTLEQNIETLTESGHTFPLLKQKYQSEEARELLKKKGEYPYSFVESVWQLENVHTLPSKEEFFNDLNQKEISDKDYAHAEKVWEYFGCESLADYTRIYCEVDTILLAECVIALQTKIFMRYGVELAFYLSLPMLAKDVMLKTTHARLELISDPEMATLLEKNIRGGVSLINTRFVNVKRLGRKIKKKLSCAYLDANNLYGCAMSYPLPLRDFRWMSEEEIECLDISDMNLRGEKGYILEVDLEYPPELHVEHSSFPLAAESLEVTEEDLSTYSVDCLRIISGKTNHHSKKLTSSFRPRKNYLVHGLNLQYYLKKGLKLTKIHRVITFVQQTFMKDFIGECTTQRATAKTKAEGDMYKLICNSIYGKFLENVTKRMKCYFNFTKEDATRRTSSPRLMGTTICTENMSISFMRPEEIVYKQQWAVGFTILEISKLIMQQHWYDVIRPAFDGQAMLLMTDTDSFCFVAPAKSPDAIVKKIEHAMDFSNYAPSHPLFTKKNKMVVGYLKNELPKTRINSFAGIRAKTYTFDLDEGSKVVCKGVKKAVTKKLPFKAFVKCINTISSKTVTQRSLISKNHVNRLIRSRKIAFSSFDDKRYLLCPIHSVPYGSILTHKKKCFFCENPAILK